VGTIILTVSVWGVFKLKRFNNSYLFLGVGAVLIIALELLIVPNLTVRSVSSRTVRSFPSTELEVSDLIYPTSVPIEEALHRFSFLIPDYQPKRSILVVVLDALRKDFTGASVEGEPVTPNIDEVTKHGMKFDNYYVQGSWTKASTASLFTGEYLHDHGVCIGDNRQGYGQKLSLESVTIAERLRSLGYKNYGAAFIAHLNKRFNFDQGFHFWLSPDSGYRDDINSLRVLLFKLLREQPERFFLYYHLKGPHSSYEEALANRSFWEGTRYYENGKLKLEWKLPHPSKLTRTVFDQWKKKADRSMTVEQIRKFRYLYAAQLNFFDREHIARLQKGLKGMGVYRDSFLAITGDHGEQLFDDYQDGQTRYGHFLNLHESVINVPLVVKLPESRNEGDLNQAVRPEFLESIDLTATLLDFAEVPVKGIRGESFLNALKGVDPDGDFTYALSEQCGLTGKVDLSTFSRKDLQESLRILKIAFPSTLGLLRHNFKNGRTGVYRRTKTGFEETQHKRSDELTERLMKKYHESVGSNEVFKRLPGGVIKMDKRTLESLKGLGYVN
jgi:arylsulfatase A-like enzyme